MFILFSLLLISFIDKIYCDPLFSNAEIAFFYGKQYYAEYLSISTFQDIKQHPKFDVNRPSVIYIHGYKEGLFSKSVQTVINAYQCRDDYNIFALDWSNYSAGNYLTDAVPSVIGLGQLIGICLNYWIDEKVLDDKRLHIVGHSLGAQMSGYIGKWLNLFSKGARKVKRITGLDPAKPLFYTNLTAMITYIHKDDAELVDIIHTNAGLLGSAITNSNCDYFPNGGIFQPGCTIKSEPHCDHSRSWEYYAESVCSREPVFYAIQCESYAEFKLLSCSPNASVNYMGFHTTDNCSGVYYLQTSQKSPYARGVFGIQYYPITDTDRQN